MWNGIDVWTLFSADDVWVPKYSNKPRSLMTSGLVAFTVLPDYPALAVMGKVLVCCAEVVVAEESLIGREG